MGTSLKYLLTHATSVIVLAGFWSFMGCASSQKISLNADGSAVVNASLDILEGDEAFYSNSTISGLFIDGTGVHFSISDIDSLGSLLSPIYDPNVFIFRYRQDSLEITQRDGAAFMPTYERGACCHSWIEITSAMKIRSVRTENAYVRRKRNSVIIYKGKKSYSKSEKNLSLVVLFDR